ncbi:MAG: enoyl-CoA hydratase-related protein [Gammaproteobacteria bacterium]
MPTDSTTHDWPFALEQRGKVLSVTLDRQQAGNPLDLETMRGLRQVFASLTENRDVNVVVIGAAGAAFCSGYDLAEIAAMQTPAERRRHCLASNDLMIAIGESPKATIARVQGLARGPGLELVLACDLALASSAASFVADGIDAGLWEHSAQVPLSRRLGRAAAMELLLTGRTFDATDALRTGLVNRVVDAEALATTVDALADQIATKSPHAISLGKRSFARQAALELTGAYEFAADELQRDVQSEDARAGLAALLNRHAPDGCGG